MKYSFFFCFASSIRKYDTDDLINTYLKISCEAKANTEMLAHSDYTMHDKRKFSLFIQGRHKGENRYSSTHSLPCHLNMVASS